MSDLVEVRSKDRKPYWISRGLLEKHPDDYTEVKKKTSVKKGAPAE